VLIEGKGDTRLPPAGLHPRFFKTAELDRDQMAVATFARISLEDQLEARVR